MRSSRFVNEKQTGGFLSARCSTVDSRIDYRYGIGNEYFQVERSGNGLIADHARREAVLTYGSEDACVHSRASRLDDLQIRGLTSLIDNHSYNDLAVIAEQASGVVRICYDINFVDQLGSDYSG